MDKIILYRERQMLTRYTCRDAFRWMKANADDWTPEGTNLLYHRISRYEVKTISRDDILATVPAVIDTNEGRAYFVGYDLQFKQTIKNADGFPESIPCIFYATDKNNRRTFSRWTCEGANGRRKE